MSFTFVSILVQKSFGVFKVEYLCFAVDNVRRSPVPFLFINQMMIHVEKEGTKFKCRPYTNELYLEHRSFKPNTFLSSCAQNQFQHHVRVVVFTDPVAQKKVM